MNTSIVERMRRHRAWRIKAGLRLSRPRLVYDLSDAKVLARFNRASAAIAAHARHEAEVDEWCNAVRCTDGWA